MFSLKFLYGEYRILENDRLILVSFSYKQVRNIIIGNNIIFENIYVVNTKLSRSQKRFFKWLIKENLGCNLILEAKSNVFTIIPYIILGVFEHQTIKLNSIVCSFDGSMGIFTDNFYPMCINKLMNQELKLLVIRDLMNPYIVEIHEKIIQEYSECGIKYDLKYVNARRNPYDPFREAIIEIKCE